jgi:hypothetical protein
MKKTFLHTLFLLILACGQLGAMPAGIKFLRPDSEIDKSGFFVGPLYGMYQYHISGPEIYMWRKNNGYIDPYGSPSTKRQLEVKDRFGNINHYYGGMIGLRVDGPISYSLLWQHQRSVSDIEYTYDNGPSTPVYNYYQKVKMTMNWVMFAFGTQALLNRNLFLGGSIDIGMLKTTTKVDDTGNPAEGGKWAPWFYSFKVLGDGITPRTPIASVSLVGAYDIGKFTLRYSHNWGLLNGDMNSQTNKYTNIPWSSKSFPVASNTFALLYNFN